MASPPRDPAKEATKVLQQRILQGAVDVLTPQYIRAYWRAHPHKLVEFAADRVPRVVEGAGENGEHVFTVHHAIKSSPLDLVGAPASAPPLVIEGEVLPNE